MGEFSWGAATHQSGYELGASNTSLNSHWQMLCHGQRTGGSEERIGYKRRLTTGAALTVKQKHALMRCFRVRGIVAEGRYRSGKGVVISKSN